MSTNPSEETHQTKPDKLSFEERHLQDFEGSMRLFTYLVTLIFLGWFVIGSQADSLSNGLFYTVLAILSMYLSTSCAFMVGRGAKGRYPYSFMMFVWMFSSIQFILRILTN